MRVSKILIGVPFFLIMSACGADENEPVNEEHNEQASHDNEIYVTTSFSITADFVSQVIGDLGEVDYLVPIGEEPHEYEPVPSDFRNVTDADVFYTNGMGLEEWIERLVENTGNTEIVSLSDGVTEIPLDGEDGVDPHAWLSPKNAEVYIANILADVTERFPEHADEFEANAEAYLDEIDNLLEYVDETLDQIPEENRIVVVSENAFKYFGEDYGFQTAGIWEINSGEEGTTGQINAVIDLVREQDIPALFVETTVDNRYMETVSENTDVPIAGEVYTDAVGLEGSGAETYIDMIRHNADVFAEGLK
ncbi:metal ABC transporter solute-binding protein, Zn/Mn family [Salisediminibacterium selenitireducens]|uniref:Periplasmic solute binding protein n=1 Tax=Bacillus selenitireducens (strain ATCC 700615 / DSM 15326 / MLS10) TaxID=439292 RepID=D6XWV3_BACIE|nr:zinc ABC transporter substrate-binding protein [Salisediminibacterium selenitireducens]ADH99929.1 periplasmic solute binding protein [[Bacillus] selenitireducens MLS10]